jgi:hypothetical protein
VRPGVALLFVFFPGEGLDANALRALVADSHFRRLAAHIANVACVFGPRFGSQGSYLQCSASRCNLVRRLRARRSRAPCNSSLVDIPASINISDAIFRQGLNVKVSVADVRVEGEVKLMDFTKWLDRTGAGGRGDRFHPDALGI